MRAGFETFSLRFAPRYLQIHSSLLCPYSNIRNYLWMSFTTPYPSHINPQRQYSGTIFATVILDTVKLFVASSTENSTKFLPVAAIICSIWKGSVPIVCHYESPLCCQLIRHSTWSAPQLKEVARALHSIAPTGKNHILQLSMSTWVKVTGCFGQPQVKRPLCKEWENRWLHCNQAPKFTA